MGLKVKPIIFLDLDGVFNCQIFYESKQYKDYKDANKKLKKSVKSGTISKLEYYSSKICRERIGWFNSLCKDIDAEVVISASIRVRKTVQELQEIFNYSGATFKIIGKTEKLGYERGIEISKWLRDNIKPETHGCEYFDFHSFAIIDDNSDFLINQRFNLFQTDEYSGLTPNTCYKIKRFITGQTFGKNID